MYVPSLLSSIMVVDILVVKGGVVHREEDTTTVEIVNTIEMVIVEAAEAGQEEVGDGMEETTMVHDEEEEEEVGDMIQCSYSLIWCPPSSLCRSAKLPIYWLLTESYHQAVATPTQSNHSWMSRFSNTTFCLSVRCMYVYVCIYVRPPMCACVYCICQLLPMV